MNRSAHGVFAMTAAAAIVVLGPVTTVAQAPQAAPPAKVSQARQVPAETTAAARTRKGWAPPKTSWGHPDLQGVWTSDDMRSVPTSRPEAMAGRTSLTPEEFARRASGDEGNRDRAVNRETVLRNEYGVRTFGYTSLVTDPADGRVPPMTAEGLKRAAARDGGTFGPGPFNNYEDFSMYDRCITRHSDKLKMTERLTRIDPEMIDYEATIDDPVTYTRPFTIRMTITTQPDYQLYEYACHEGNGAVKYALSGERAYEKSVTDAVAKGLPIPPRDRGSPYGPPAPGVAPARIVE